MRESIFKLYFDVVGGEKEKVNAELEKIGLIDDIDFDAAKIGDGDDVKYIKAQIVNLTIENNALVIEYGWEDVDFTYEGKAFTITRLAKDTWKTWDKVKNFVGVETELLN